MAWSWVAAVLVLASSASAAQLRGVTLTPNWFAQGTVFAMTSEDQRAEIARAARMGSNVVRLHVDWPGLQPDGQIDGAYQAQLDQAVQSAHHYGQAVILDVTTTPCWAAKEPVCPLTRAHRFDPPRPEAFGELTRYLLARYPSLYALEVWNEPNCCPPVARFWNGTPADFAAIVNAAVDARNGIGSRTRVIVGGFLPIWDAGAGMLNDVYEAGMRGQDGIAIHPYSMVDGQWTSPMKPSSPFDELIRATHRIMLAHGDRGGLYVTEFGFAPCPARPCVPAPIAQRWIAGSYRVAARYRYVRALTAFSARDYGTGADAGWQVHSGILNRPFGQIRRTLLRLNSKHPRKRRGKRHVGRKK